MEKCAEFEGKLFGKTKSGHEFSLSAIGVSVEQEKKALIDLLKVGAIQKNKSLYEPRLKRINIMGDKKGERRIREYWTRRALEFLNPDVVHPQKPRQAVWPYMIFNTNSEAFTKIRKQLIDLYEQIQILSQSDKGSNGLYLFNAQLLEIKDLPVDDKN